MRLHFMALRGSPSDLDILVCPERDHVARMLASLADFGFPSAEVSPDYVLSENKILQLARFQVQIRLMTTITGVDLHEAWGSRVTGTYGGVRAFFLGRSALIKNKSAAGRAKDLADLEALRDKRG